MSRFEILAWFSRNRVLLSLALSLGILVIARPIRDSLVLGLPFVLLGEALRIWSSGCIRKNDLVSREGPYSVSRNPLYLGNFLIGAGFVLATGLLWLTIPYTVLFFVLYHFTIRYEEEFLLRKFGGEYEAYLREVPRFLTPGAFARYRSGLFSWRLVAEHREWRNLPVIMGVFLLLWGRSLLDWPWGGAR